MFSIQNGNISLTIVPEAGGRIVSLQCDGGENLLKSDSKLWNGPHPTASPDLLDFTAYNGHEVWIGPQSEWWKHQTLNAEKRESTLFWPPDPYISYGRFTITEQTADAVTMEGPSSPISGLKMVKRISIDNEGKVHFEVTATNTRKEPVSWDLWMLTRTNGNNPTFVPVANENEVNVGEPTHDYEGPAPYNIENGYFTFCPQKRDKSYEACTAKAFIHPARPYIATISCGKVLVIRFEHHDQFLLHPEQTEVEIYNYASDDDGCLMEMEYHAPYRTLQPGEQMSTSEVWEVMDYDNRSKATSIYDFLDKL